MHFLCFFVLHMCALILLINQLLEINFKTVCLSITSCHEYVGTGWSKRGCNQIECHWADKQWMTRLREQRQQKKQVLHDHKANDVKEPAKQSALTSTHTQNAQPKQVQKVYITVNTDVKVKNKPSVNEND